MVVLKAWAKPTAASQWAFNMDEIRNSLQELMFESLEGIGIPGYEFMYGNIESVDSYITLPKTGVEGLLLNQIVLRDRLPATAHVTLLFKGSQCARPTSNGVHTKLPRRSLCHI
jgi:hypothetical protein